MAVGTARPRAAEAPEEYGDSRGPRTARPPGCRKGVRRRGVGSPSPSPPPPEEALVKRAPWPTRWRRLAILATVVIASVAAAAIALAATSPAIQTTTPRAE